MSWSLPTSLTSSHITLYNELLPIPGKMPSPESLPFLSILNPMHCPQMYAWMDLLYYFVSFWWDRPRSSHCKTAHRHFPSHCHLPLPESTLIMCLLVCFCFFSATTWLPWEEGLYPHVHCSIFIRWAVWQDDQTISISWMNNSDLLWNKHILFMVCGNVWVLFKLFNDL